MAVTKTGGLAFCASLALASCGGGGSPGSGGTTTPTPPPPVVRNYTFPMGDATSTSGTTAWDIVGVTTTLTGQFANANGDSYDTLRVDVTFAQNVSAALPEPGQQLSTAGNELGVGIGLDTDANSNTGFASGCSRNQKGFEYLTDQGNDPNRLADGNYSIVGSGGPISAGGANAPAEAMTSVSGSVFSQTIFLTAIGVHGGQAAPKIGISVAAGNGTQANASGSGPQDCVPILPSVEVFTV